jgi:DNA-binding Lrp family transcriptional regulator
MGSMPERRKRQYYALYRLLHKKPRIEYKEIGEILGIDRRTASIIVKEALEQGYLGGPQCRKKSYRNFLEYVYFVRSPKPEKLYRKLRKDRRIAYQAKMSGFSALWVVASEDIPLDGEIVVKGPRTDYYMSLALDRSWDHAFSTIHSMIEDFDSSTYVPRKYIQEHWDETVEWSDADEILFQEMKYDLRKAVEPLAKEKYHMGCGVAYGWLERLPECCTITVSYYPEKITAYDPYLFMFETEYEDFVVELFSQLPVSTFFFKVADKLFVYFHVKKELIRIDGRNALDFDRLQIPLLMRELRDRGIITSCSYAIVEYFWEKDL